VSKRTNWAGNLTYSTESLTSPATVEEVRQAVRAARKLRVLGSRHSFNGIADSAAEQISLDRLTDISFDEQARTVTAQAVNVGAGVTYEQLAPCLATQNTAKHGYALANLASLPGISIAGACATATHGSGIANGNLATAVRALDMVTADGELLQLDRDDPKFAGAVVALGAAGVVTRMTLDVEPTFQIAQTVYENLRFDELGRNFAAIFSSGYSVSVFTCWQQQRATQVWIKKRVDSRDSQQWPQEFYGATRQKTRLHPLAGHDASSCTEQMGIAGAWHERLPHFASGKTPSSGQELQSEYFVPFEHGFAAVRALEALQAEIAPHLFVSELRAVAADQLWMSTAYERLSLAIHFTWKADWDAVGALLPRIEAALRPFDARPHWGKLFTMPASEIARVYPRMKDFKALLAELDPGGKFRNEFVDSCLYAG
jgi:xylitol oxidase